MAHCVLTAQECHGCYQIPLYTIMALSLAEGWNVFIWFPLHHCHTPALAAMRTHLVCPTTAVPLG